MLRVLDSKENVNPPLHSRGTVSNCPRGRTGRGPGEDSVGRGLGEEGKGGGGKQPLNKTRLYMSMRGGTSRVCKSPAAQPLELIVVTTTTTTTTTRPGGKFFF